MCSQPRLGHQKETFWYLFERDVAITPVVDWNEMYPSDLEVSLWEGATKGHIWNMGRVNRP